MMFLNHTVMKFLIFAPLLFVFIIIPVYADTSESSVSILNVRITDSEGNSIEEIITNKEAHFKFDLHNNFDESQEIVSIFYWLQDGKKDVVGTTSNTIAPSGTLTDIDYSFLTNYEGMHTFVIEVWNKEKTTMITTVILGPITVYDVENRSVLLNPISFRHLFTIGEGSADGQFLNLFDYAVDKEGNFFVVDDERNQIQKFDSDGNFLLKWGSFCYFEFQKIDCTDPDGVLGPLKVGDGQFYSPGHIAVDDEQVYVVDRKNYRIQVFDKYGNFLYKFGDRIGSVTTPSTAGLFYSKGMEIVNDRIYVSDLSGVTIFEKNGKMLYHADRTSQEHVIFNKSPYISTDQLGRKLVMDKDNDQIEVFSDKKDLLFTVGKPSSLPGKFSMPNGITVDDTGQIYVADTRNHRVQVFDKDGNYRSSFGKEGTEEGQFLYPQGVAVDNNTGNIHVTDSGNNRIQVFDKYGTFLFTFTKPTDYPGRFVPNGIEVNSSRIYVSDEKDSSAIFDMNGRYLFSLEVAFSGWAPHLPPDGITVNGDLTYITDSAENRILIFDKSSKPSHILELWEQTSVYSEISGIDLDKFGIIYVVDHGRHLVLLLGYDGRHLIEIGERGSNDGQFYSPQGIVLDDDRKLYVSDTGNHRIQVFEIFTPDNEIENDMLENDIVNELESIFDLITNFYKIVLG